MPTLSKHIFGLLLFLLFQATLSAQKHHKQTDSTSHASSEHRKHSIAILIGHSHISQGFQNGKQDWWALPSYAIDYNYRLSRHFSFGLHNDIIVEDFVVETKANDENQSLSREYPFLVCLVSTYHFKEHFGFTLGFGREFEPVENFNLIRLGAEANFNLPNHFELLINLVYDYKLGGYDTWVHGVGIAKLF